jgi:anti-sigma B factor antagonist
VDRPGAHFDVRREDGIAILSVSGELDLSEMAQYTLARDEVLGAGLPLVMNFEACEFIDSSGLQGIIQTFNLAVEAGQPAALAGSGVQVKRVLHLSGMADLLPYFERLEDAVAHVRH